MKRDRARGDEVASLGVARTWAVENERAATEASSLAVARTQAVRAEDERATPGGPVDVAAGERDTLTSAPPLLLPDVEHGEGARMREVIAARLFPRRVEATRIGRYRIVDRLGSGGMGVVYLAHDPELDRTVAIKLLLGDGLSHEAEARLHREAQAMARVAHANVVQVIEVGVHEGRTYVVMEHLRGVSLDRWHERRRSWRETVAVYVQAGRGLAAAHRGGVIHRDFKPHNAILVEGGVDDGRVKVLDFGLARAADAATEGPGGDVASNDPLAARLTRTGAMMGTPAYMAPEQLSGAPASARSDQYSFAVSLYEALYDQLPYDVRDFSSLLHAVLLEPLRPPPPDTDTPAWLHKVIVRGLERDPELRFPDMDALCDALERDPRVRRRSIAAAATLSVAVGLGGWGVARLNAESPCSGPAFESSALWDRISAEAVARAFTATGHRDAGATANRVDAALGAYAAGWSQARQGACMAHQRGELSATRLDLGMECLERRRVEAAALAGLLVAADAAAVDHAVEAALSLPSVAGCDDAEALAVGAAPPEKAAEVAAVRTRLAEASAAAGLGRYARAGETATELLAPARALEFQPLIAEVALALGEFAMERGDADDAESSLALAVDAAIQGRADRIAAEAITRRVYVRGVLLGDAARAAGDEALASAYAARFAGDGALQWLTAMNLGGSAHRRGDLERAREHYRRALAVEDGPTALERARTRINLGILEYDDLDFAAALAADQAAIAEASAAVGDDHPLVRLFSLYEANALAALGRRHAAHQRLEAIVAGIDVAEDPRLGVWPRIRLARLDAHFGRHEVARAHARAAVAAADPSDAHARLLAASAEADALTDADACLAAERRIVAEAEAAFGADDEFVTTLRQHAAGALLGRGRPAEALDWARRAVGEREARRGRQHPLYAEALRLLADVLLALDEASEAGERAASAVAILAAHRVDLPLERALAERALGHAKLRLGAHDEAIAGLRRAFDRLAPRVDADDPELAETAALLAEALLAGGDPGGEAGALLERAGSIYRDLGDAFAAEIASLDRLRRRR